MLGVLLDWNICKLQRERAADAACSAAGGQAAPCMVVAFFFSFFHSLCKCHWGRGGRKEGLQGTRGVHGYGPPALASVEIEGLSAAARWCVCWYQYILQVDESWAWCARDEAGGVWWADATQRGPLAKSCCCRKAPSLTNRSRFLISSISVLHPFFSGAVRPPSPLSTLAAQLPAHRPPRGPWSFRRDWLFYSSHHQLIRLPSLPGLPGPGARWG